jgi:hypothetical protein
MVDGPARRKISKSNLEVLSDARLLLDTAAHNVSVVARSAIADDGFDNAIAMTEQALAALTRVRQSLA